LTAAYARVSSDRQEKDQTIDSQLDALHRGERREVGGASGQSHIGARLGLGFKGLTVAGTPNFSTLPYRTNAFEVWKQKTCVRMAA
jgi:hypothetical protein